MSVPLIENLKGLAVISRRVNRSVRCLWLSIMGMKRRNRLWLISSAMSVLYIGAAILAFYQFQHLMQTLKYYGISEEEQLRLDNVVQMRNGIILAGSVFLLFGLLSAIISYGLLRSQA